MQAKWTSKIKWTFDVGILAEEEKKDTAKTILEIDNNKPV